MLIGIGYSIPRQTSMQSYARANSCKLRNSCIYNLFDVRGHFKTNVRAQPTRSAVGVLRLILPRLKCGGQLLQLEPQEEFIQIERFYRE